MCKNMQNLTHNLSSDKCVIYVGNYLSKNSNRLAFEFLVTYQIN